MLQFDFTEPRNGVAPCRFVDPRELVIAYHLHDVMPALRRVQQAVDSGKYAAGFVSYEAAPAFDPAMTVPAAGEMPLVWFGLFDRPVPLSTEPLYMPLGRDPVCTDQPAPEHLNTRDGHGGPSYQSASPREH